MEEPPRDRDPSPVPPPAVRVSLASLGLVWVGGSVGSGTRYLIGRAVPQLGAVPVATIAVNVIGAFALGVLLETLSSRRLRARPRADVLRLLLGTGFLGGFTTYSALAVDTVSLARSQLAVAALAYASTTVVVGALASLAGIAVASRWWARA